MKKVIGDGNSASVYKFYNIQLVPWSETEWHTAITSQPEESKESAERDDSLMLVTICDDTWIFAQQYIQHITSNWKSWDYSDIAGGGHKISQDPPTWLKMATTIEKPPTATRRPKEALDFSVSFSHDLEVGNLMHYYPIRGSPQCL